MRDSHYSSQPNADGSKLRGKTALDIWHRNISNDEEKRINNKISNLYNVDLEEAKEIHINYHSARIMSLVLDLAKKHGMTEPTFIAKQRDLDIQQVSYQVSVGELIEIAAVELLYKQLCDISKTMSSQRTEDRYINFYG